MAVRRPWSLQRAFARLLLLAALLPAIAFALIMVVSERLDERRELSERLATSARLTAANIDTFLANQLAGVALLADARSARPEDWDADLADLLRRFPDLLTVLVTDAQGRVLAAHTRDGPVETRLEPVDDREYFTVPRRTGRANVSEAFLGRGLGADPLVAVSAPLRRARRFDGVIEASIRVDTFTGELNKAFVARGYEMMLVDQARRVVAATPGMGVAFLDPVDVERRFAAPRGGGAAFRNGVLADGGGGFVARAELGNGWTQILVFRQTSLAYGVTRRLLVVLGMLVLVTAGVGLAVWWQAQQLNRGTGDLLHSLQAFALGGDGRRSSAQAMPVELRPLAVAIDDLSVRLNKAYGHVTASVREQRRLAESLREVVASREREIAERTEQLRRAVTELDRISRTDPLTGCLNVRGLKEWLSSHWRRDESGSGDERRLGVLALDVDHFKTYNDHYGHPAGDTTLRRVAGVMHGALRGPDDQVVRAGGEEFLALLPGADEGMAHAVAERIRLAVREAAIPHAATRAGLLTVSIGWSIGSPQADASPDSVLQRADQALYRAKQGGRDRVAGPEGR